MTIAITKETEFSFGGRPEESGKASGPRMRLLGWKPHIKSTLRGFADIETASGLQIAGIGLHQNGPNRWIGMPGKPVLENDQHVAGPNDKKPWAKVISFRGGKVANAFRDQVIALVLAQHPDAFDGGNG
jgi:hypothetical protein